jgi:hypothetical protein
MKLKKSVEKTTRNNTIKKCPDDGIGRFTQLC